LPSTPTRSTGLGLNRPAFAGFRGKECGCRSRGQGRGSLPPSGLSTRRKTGPPFSIRASICEPFPKGLALLLLLGAARLGQSGHPAPDAALLAVKRLRLALFLRVQIFDFLNVAQLGIVAVPAPALKLALVKGQ
jgi:hypothetical protein